MESRLLEILVCPLCKGPLRHDRVQQELICQAERLAFPIRDGVPIMLPDEARPLSGAGSAASDAASPAAAAPADSAAAKPSDTPSGDAAPGKPTEDGDTGKPRQS